MHTSRELHSFWCEWVYNNRNGVSYRHKQLSYLTSVLHVTNLKVAGSRPEKVNVFYQVT
jgi:hypothetical protein